MGGFHYKPNERGEVPYSQSTYYFMSHIMLVTNLPSAYSAYEKLAFPFHPFLWQAICVLLALSCLSLWLLQRFWKQLPQVNTRERRSWRSARKLVFLLE